MKVGNLSILQELLQVRQKLLIKCETHNIPRGGWKKKSALERKIKCCSSDRWCSTKGQPLAHSAAHYLLTIFLTLALLQESSVMQIIKRYFIVQGLLQVQQKVCKVISVLQGTFEDACASRAQPACKVKMKWKSFHGSPAWPVSYPDFSPHLTQNKTAKVTDVTVFTSCHSSGVTSARLTGNLPYPASWGHCQGLPCSFHSRAGGHNLLPLHTWDNPCRMMDTPGDFCAPSLLEQRTCNWFYSSFRCEHWGKRAHTTAMTLLQTAQPKRTQKDPTGKIRDTSIGVSPLLPPRKDQHKYDYINKK